VKPEAPPPARYAFGYRTPPRSGNAINGLGVKSKERARHVFHRAGGPPIEWQALDEFFSFINPWGVVRHMLVNAWQLRRREGTPTPGRVEGHDPATLGRMLREEAMRRGAGLVGFTRVTEEDLFQGKDAPYPHAICIGVPMNRKEMRFAPAKRAAVEVMRTYRRAGRLAVELAEVVRSLGWQARAYGNPNSTDILHIPLAIRAGLGQLGKHGSMISKEFGSNFRLSAVLTDLPLPPDQPVDIGVDDLCLHCRRCVIDCPPEAIFNDKQWVRGEYKWYVDFDKCVPYFVKTYGCAICIEVCPWSEPGRGPRLAETLLSKRSSRPATAPPTGTSP
jgi:NAD-dependent dihydropyrimidine dehydrogenase PreA subunit